jgi:hypothetical protein
MTQSGCRLPSWSTVAIVVGRSIEVSSYTVHSGPAVLLRKEVITTRTWLWADVRAFLNFGHTQAKCVRYSGIAPEQCGKVGDLAIPIRFNFQICLDRVRRVGASHTFFLFLPIL